MRPPPDAGPEDDLAADVCELWRAALAAAAALAHATPAFARRAAREPWVRALLAGGPVVDGIGANGGGIAAGEPLGNSAELQAFLSAVQ